MEFGVPRGRKYKVPEIDMTNLVYYIQMYIFKHILCMTYMIFIITFI